MPQSTLKHLVHGLHFQSLRGDIFGGLTAAVVALPLALAFGVSSGIGAINGLYGAVFVGFLAALFGGTPVQISGPTGPMTVVITTVFAAFTARYGPDGIAMTFTVVMLGGLFQILFGVLRLGKFITLMPYTVISGFMSGIGLIIILIEIGPLLGYASAGGVVNAVQQLPEQLTHPVGSALGLGILTLVIVFGSPPRLNRILPAPLLALIVCTLVSLSLNDEQLLRIGEIPTGLPSFYWPSFELSQMKLMIGYGLMLGTLGAIDSLLTSLVADNISHSQHDSDRELIGQGIGNAVAGLLGGLPGAGATMRTVINVRAGGKTPLSGMTHALVLLGVVLGAGSLTEPIPHAVLAGILIKVGIDIIDWSFLKRAHRVSLKATGIMYGVMFLTVFVDLITAVAVGVFVANLLTIQRLSELQIDAIQPITDPRDPHCNLSRLERQLLTQASGKILLLNLGGPMSFGAAKAISQQMGIVKKYDILILDLTEVPMLGVTAALAIETIVKEALAKHRTAFLVGISGQVEARLERLGLLDHLQPRQHGLTRLEALEQATRLLKPAVPTASEMVN
ncbi:MAG: SulP family inorganic anion transporter [Leptolyngbya sp. SIO4C1]|nr:SulP family inorganic anion transporter [Leptolyngbya sp. SIO4C1]